ncbi:VWA domain-containing protein, partial [Myxococcota bacterium]|nr:VWA domain-containing protein [Myxococcota bacterium]
GRDCGGDGCGGECGQCPWGAVCGAEGRCQATPAACGDAICDPDEDCATCEVDCGRCCGDGRCGGDETCAACPADCPCAEGLRCDAQANTCVSDCIPQCEGRACGDDGCEGECGACPDGFTCDNLGQCAPPPIRCGDGVCQASEGCATCAADCACAEGLRCDAGGDTCVPACVPACEGLACGPDGCGGDCGLCAGNDRCEGGRCVGGCEGGCVVGEVSCEPDGVSYRACVPAPESPQCGVLTRRVPCDEGRACGAEGCGGACSRPEILLVVDRSSSMEGARWAMVSDVIADFCDRYGEVARVQLRLFPSADACGAGPILPCDEVALSPPSAAGETPIAAALTDAGAAFGDPNEGEVVILITDGDETCADESAPLAPTRLLRARGAQVFTIGVSQLANGALLDAVAEAGGAGSARRVNDGAQLWSALLDIYEGLDGCDCAPSQSGEAACYQGEFLLCRGLDGQREPYFTAPEGTCACDPLAQQLRCVDQGLIRCGEAGWTFEGGQPGVQLCVDGEIGRCGEDANIPEGCAWMLESDEARCGDGIDNDGNGYADCAEWSCLHNPAVSACAEARAGLEITEALCTDGIDNDGNGYADCQDYHCARNLWINACGNDERDDIACADGLDNDLNGFIDCDDWDCSRSPTVSVCPSGCPAQLPEVRLGGWTPLVAAPEGGCRCQIGEQACRDGRVLECNHAGFWAWPGETARCVAEVEPNDTRGTAQAVAGLPAFMEGGCQGEDWLRFEVQAGVSYVISRAFAPGGTDFDAYLMLFDPQGVAINVDPDYPGDAFNVIYGWTAPTSGTYTLRVRCEPHLGATDYGLHLYPLR